MARADVAAKPAPVIDARAADAAIPRVYNFAADILARNLEAGRADKPVYIDPRGSLTYGQLAERVDRFGHLLRLLGIRREERILLALLDTIDWPTAFLGAVKAGVVPVPVNTLMTEDDYRFMLADSRARLLVAALLPKFANLIGASADLLHVIVSGENGQGYARFEDVLAQAKGGPIPRRPRATTSASGFIPRARPASPRAPCMCTPICASPPTSTPAACSACGRMTSATRWRSCSSPTASAMP